MYWVSAGFRSVVARNYNMGEVLLGESINFSDNLHSM